ncbi:L-cystine-binding protein FliY [compost metagenome]
MKKFAALLLVSSVALFAACGKNESAPTAASTGSAAASKIIVGLDDNFPPMGFRDTNNELVGFDIDMAKEASRRLGMTVEFKPIDWSAKEAELNGKRVDVLWNGLTITEERKKNISFKADLAGRIVGAQDGSSAVDAIKKEGQIAASLKELKTFGDNVTALMDLSAGRLDAIVVDEVVGRYLISKRAGEYRVLEENFGTEEYGVGVRKDDAELLGKLDQTLASMKQDGTAARIATQWFGADITK